MRPSRWFWALACGLLLPAEGASAQTVLVYKDRTTRAFSPGQAVPKEGLGGLDHAWVWSETSAPRRVEAEELGRVAAPEDRLRLTVRVPYPGERLPPGYRVRAAPQAMWGEVPEDLLPQWPVPESGRLRLPLDPGRPWRLRLLGPGLGTWWLDLPPGQRMVEARPLPAATKELVVTGADGAPVAASLTVLASAHGRGDSRVLAQLRADAKGQLALEALPDLQELTLVVAEAQHAPAALVARPSSLPPKLRLERGCTVEGRFLNPRGKPLTGVEVRAEAWVSERVPATAARAAESAEDGRWQLATLPCGPVVLVARAAGFAPYRTEVDLRETRDLGIVTLAPGLSLPAVVVDDAGLPVPGAVIAGAGGLQAVTDQRGQAVLEGVPAAGRLALAARADGHLPAEVSSSPPLPERLEITLRRAFRLLGRLVDGDGAAVAGGTVRVVRGSAYQEEPLRADGSLELELEPALPLELVLRSPATVELRLKVEPGLPGEVKDLGDLAAPSGVEVQGRLLHALDATPVAGARVWCPRPSDQGEVVAWVHGDFLETRSREDGTFELGGLPRHPVLLRVDAPGLARLHLPAEPDPGESLLDLGDLALSAGSTVRVRADGDATDGSVARVDLRNQWLEVDMLTAAVLEGEAAVDHVPEGQVTVTVLHGRELLCEEPVVVPAASEVEVDCSQGGMRVSGLVTAGGRAAGPGMLLWLPRQSSAAPGIIMNLRSPGGLRQQHVFGAGRPQVDVAVDGEGRFATHRLRPGEWSVIWAPDAGGTTATQDVEVPSLVEWSLRLVFDDRSLTGVVVGRDEAPVAGARVWVSSPGAMAISGPDGRFAVAGLATGSYRLHARLGELTSAPAEVVMEPDREPEPVRLILEERPDDRLTIQVVDPEDGSAAGAFVFLEMDQQGLRILTADSRGRVSAPLYPPHPERVRAAAVADGRWVFGSWLDLAQARPGLTLEVPESGTLRVASRELAGAVEIASAGGWDVSWLLTRFGARPLVSPELPLIIRGLPEGTYRVRLGSFTAQLALRDGETAEVEIR